MHGLVEMTEDYDKIKRKLEVTTAERDQVKSLIESGNI